jgi:hypothetical protein
MGEKRARGDSVQRRPMLFKGAAAVWSSEGGSEAAPHDEEVGRVSA